MSAQAFIDFRGEALTASIARFPVLSVVLLCVVLGVFYALRKGRN